MTRVCVIGAGTMGHGIAQMAALAGYDTALTDVLAKALVHAKARIDANLEGGIARGKLSREAADATRQHLAFPEHLQEAAAGADLVIEAIVEDLDAKRSLIGEVDRLVSPQCVLATNTSSLSVGRIAAASSAPERVIGMHFFNPVHIMKLVELVVHDGTSAPTLAAARNVAERLGKVPIVAKDRPGFASSRLGVVLGLEAMRMVEEGVASPEDIDTAMELGYGHPMGPLKVSDLVGLDVRLAIADYLHRELKGPWYAPPDILRRKVAAGELGKKSGRGFYEWPIKSS